MPFPKKIEVEAIAKDGEFIFEFPSYVREFLVSHDGKKLTISIAKFTRKRSSPQNRYYHGVCIPLLQSAINSYGNEYSKDEIHDFLKDRFLKADLIGNAGEILGQYTRSTTSLTTIEFMDYVLQIQKFAAETLMTIIPDPTPYFK